MFGSVNRPETIDMFWILFGLIVAFRCIGGCWHFILMGLILKSLCPLQADRDSSVKHTSLNATHTDSIKCCATFGMASVSGATDRLTLRSPNFEQWIGRMKVGEKGKQIVAKGPSNYRTQSVNAEGYTCESIGRLYFWIASARGPPANAAPNNA